MAEYFFLMQNWRILNIKEYHSYIFVCLSKIIKTWAFFSVGSKTSIKLAMFKHQSAQTEYIFYKGPFELNVLDSRNFSEIIRTTLFSRSVLKDSFQEYIVIRNFLVY